MEPSLAPERGTARRRPPETVAADADRVFETVLAGGVAIVPLDVAYAVVAAREDGVRRIFAAKRRSYEKPSGMFGSHRLSGEIHRMDQDRHRMVRTIVEEENLPFSVVAPFWRDHPILSHVDPFVIEHSTRRDTLDMLLNAGQLHNEIAGQSAKRAVPIFGSSANTSLAGSKYRYRDIEETVRRAADFHLDYGRSKYANGEGRSSTIIDFRDFGVVRVGVCFDRLRTVFSERFDTKLTIDERTAR